MQGVPCLFHPIKAVLFDLDGTLVHSALDFSRIRQEVGCPDGIDLLDFVKTLSGARKRAAEQIIHRHELEDAHSARLIEGVPELLTRLDRAGIKTGIITRNSAEATRIKLAACGININSVVTREDAAPKPDPEALHLLSRRWSADSSCCVYVGDYLYDLQAARNAGMHACLFLGAQHNMHALPDYAELADFLCEDFNNFETCLLAYFRSRA